MPVKSNREYRSMVMPFRVAQENKRFDTDYYVEGYATTFDDPYVLFEQDGVPFSEIIGRNAMDGVDLSDVIMQYDHAGRVFARTSNETLGIEPDNHGIFNFADLSRTGGAKEFHEDIAAGMVTRMSWAFTVDADEYDKSNHTRIIKRIKKIYDVSGVSLPANPATEISARSFFDGVIEREKQEWLKREQELELAKAKFYFMGGNK